MKKYTILFLIVSMGALAQIGVGAKKPKNADMMFDGSRSMLDEKWAYFERVQDNVILIFQMNHFFRAPFKA